MSRKGERRDSIYSPKQVLTQAPDRHTQPQLHPEWLHSGKSVHPTSTHSTCSFFLVFSYQVDLLIHGPSHPCLVTGVSQASLTLHSGNSEKRIWELNMERNRLWRPLATSSLSWTGHRDTCEHRWKRAPGSDMATTAEITRVSWFSKTSSQMSCPLQVLPLSS